jgi:hypothetical protein
MKGLAWFSRQIPNEGFSDVSEGRVGETEIPHSDQWINPQEDKKSNYRPDKFNRKQVIAGKNHSRGTSKILIEEIYQTREYALNPTQHNATYENGRFVFAYPHAWQNSNSVNKMVAVRRIETKPRDYNIKFTFGVAWNGDMIEKEIACAIPSNYSIQEALSAISMQLRKAYDKDDLTKGGLIFNLEYFPYGFTVVIQVYDIDGITLHDFTIESDNDGFLMLMNYPLEDKKEIYDTLFETMVFNNVRPRKEGDVFLHASFVSNSTAGYLGRGGEFYPKPSKMYSDDTQSYFFIETSLDGYNRIPLPHENIILELAFVIDSESYQSP